MGTDREGGAKDEGKEGRINRWSGFLFICGSAPVHQPKLGEGPREHPKGISLLMNMDECLDPLVERTSILLSVQAIDNVW